VKLELVLKKELLQSGYELTASGIDKEQTGNTPVKRLTTR
jgi:hypothetical protein